MTTETDEQAALRIKDEVFAGVKWNELDERILKFGRRLLAWEHRTAAQVHQFESDGGPDGTSRELGDPMPAAAAPTLGQFDQQEINKRAEIARRKAERMDYD